MATQPDIKYTQLDKATQLNIVRNRVRDLETSYMQLYLRVNSPAPGEVITEQDTANLQMLKNSLDDLHKMEDDLSK